MRCTGDVARTYGVRCALLLCSAAVVGAQQLEAPPNPGPKWPRIESSIVSKVQMAAAKRVAGTETGPPAEIVVLLQPEPGALSASIDRDQLTELGARILASSRHMLRVAVPCGQVQNLAEVRGVNFVREPRGPSLNTVVSEGVSLVGAGTNHARGVRGSGASVAVIDGGFVGANSATDEIGTTRSIDLTGRGMYTAPAEQSVAEARHGTACAEIVRDVAPDADLYLVKIYDFADFENAVDSCIARGVDIVSYSASWLDHGFGDGLGDACEVVNRAAEAGVLWVNSAGNYARRQYTGLWSNPESNTWHNFEGGVEVNELLDVRVRDQIELVLTWNEWPATSENYDLFLWWQAAGTDSLVQVARSDTRQLRAPPFEHISYIATAAGRYWVSVSKAPSARTTILKLWSYYHELSNAAALVGTIGVPADALGSFTVGAVDQVVWNHPTIAPYSSQGPTVDDRVKPDIVAPASVSTLAYGHLSFQGTSAAAPHVAGAAALVKSANPSYDADDMTDLLQRSAVDVGAPGQDNVFGYGKLALPTLTPVAVPRVTRITPGTVRYDDVVTIDGSGFGATRGTGKVVFYEGVEPSSYKYEAWGDTRIRVHVPRGSRTGSIRVIAANGESNGMLLTVLSPYITSISPTTARSGQAVTVRGVNLGATQGSSQIKLGAWDFSRVTRWGNSEVTAVVPANVYTSTVTIQTPDGMSNAVQLAITSPFVLSMTPLRGRSDDQITLTGGNFGATRGTAGAVMFGTLRPNAADYVSWSANRIVVKIPAGATSCEVKVVSAQGESEQRHLDVESSFYPIPSAGPFGYSPPIVTSTPKGVTFAFQRGTTPMALSYEITEVSDSEVSVWLNGRILWTQRASIVPTTWFGTIRLDLMVAGQNTLEFRNEINQGKSSGYDAWILRDVALWKPYQAKLAGALNIEGGLGATMATALGTPFPVPSNTGVVIPFDLAAPGDVEITVVNTLGQDIVSLVAGYIEAGSHTVAWDGRDRNGVRVASGVYIVLLRAQERISAARLVLTK